MPKPSRPASIRRGRSWKSLDRLTVGTACSASWGEMVVVDADGGRGRGDRRHCAACSRDVLDFARLSAAEIAGRIEASRGRLCGRLTFGADGHLVTLDPRRTPPESTVSAPRQAERRPSPPSPPSPIAAALLTAMLGMSGAASRGGGALQASEVVDGAVRLPPSPAPEGTATGDAGARVPVRVTRGLGSTVRGVLVAESSAPVAGVLVTLRNALDGREHSEVTDRSGAFAFSLPSGIYSLAGGSPEVEVPTLSGIAISPAQGHDLELLTTQTRPLRLLGEVAIPLVPLREVFANSELVGLATSGGSEVIEVLREGDYGVVATELHFDEVLKNAAPSGGGGVHSIVYSHVESLAHAEGEAPVLPLPAGTRVLAFLDSSGAGEGRASDGFYRSADAWRGVREVTDDEAAVYRERLRALAELETSAAATASAIPSAIASALASDGVPVDVVLDELLDWLVETVAQPVTRVGALGELQSALDVLRAIAERHGATIEATSRSLRDAVRSFIDEGGQLEREPAPEVLAAFLTSAQRDRLLDALLAIETPLQYQDLELFDLVAAPGESAASDDRAAAARGWLIGRAQELAEDPAAMFDRGTWSGVANRLDDPALHEAVEALFAEADRLAALAYSTDDGELPIFETSNESLPMTDGAAERRVRDVLDGM